MKKKILVLDLDGTLTNNEKKITPKTKKTIMKMQKAGHKVVLASGRPTRGVTPLMEELELDKYNGYILPYNGGKIIDCSTGDTVYERTLPADIVPEIFEMADELNIGMMTYDKDAIVANQHNDEFMDLESRINSVEIKHLEDPGKYIDFNVNKCLGTAKVDIAPDIVKKYADKFGDRISVSRSEPFFIELVPKGIDKAASLEKLCEIENCTREDMIACGDGFNDISMIKYAGLGVAMENAQEEVKKVADFITLSNEEDGVANVVEKFIL